MANITEQTKEYIKKYGYVPNNIIIGDSLTCENCNKTITIDVVGEEYWISLDTDMLVLGCCKNEDFLEQGGIFFAKKEKQWLGS